MGWGGRQGKESAIRRRNIFWGADGGTGTENLVQRVLLVEVKSATSSGWGRRWGKRGVIRRIRMSEGRNRGAQCRVNSFISNLLNREPPADQDDQGKRRAGKVGTGKEKGSESVGKKEPLRRGSSTGLPFGGVSRPTRRG